MAEEKRDIEQEIQKAKAAAYEAIRNHERSGQLLQQSNNYVAQLEAEKAQQEEKKAD